jgi:hypothetical protein
MIDPQSDAVTGHNGPGSGEEFSELLPHSLRETLTSQEDHLRELIRSHPLAVVFGALALGFAVARWMREA